MMQYNKVTKLNFIAGVSLLSIFGCSNNTSKIVTTCELSETYVEIKQSVDENFYRAVNIDSSGGASFRGFDFIDSATDLRRSTKILISDTANFILFKSKKNERKLENVDKECRDQFLSFIEQNNLTDLLETTTQKNK